LPSAAINEQFDPRDETGVIRRQKQHRFGNFVGIPIRPIGIVATIRAEKAMPVFWKRGFADTSLQELERATGVNKSGLYSEFRDKEDLFVACLRHYLESQEKRGFLTKEPLGWKNVETFLKNGPLNKGEQQGCFSVNSMREFAILPDEAYGVVTEYRVLLQRLIAMNIEAEKPTIAPSAIAEMVLSFFSGLCIERNIKSGKTSSTRKIESFMTALRNL